jgi:hypothetical protein
VDCSAPAHKGAWNREHCWMGGRTSGFPARWIGSFHTRTFATEPFSSRVLPVYLPRAAAAPQLTIRDRKPRDLTPRYTTFDNYSVRWRKEVSSSGFSSGEKTMALHDEILRDIIAGRLPWRFKIADLKQIPGTKPRHYRVGNGEYGENEIDTIPRNHQCSPDGTNPGDYVRKGRKPAFLWYGEGEYELVLCHQHCLEDSSRDDEEFDRTEGDREELIRGPDGETAIRRPLPMRVDDALVTRIAEKHADPAVMIVRYVAEMPFQGYRRRRRVGSTKHGWGERLAAYYWHGDWQTTCARLDGFSSQIRRAITKLKERADDRVAADELLNAFKDACVWGGVRLPEPDSCALAVEVLNVCKLLSQGQEPHSGYRLNSAWTKLYALALPDRCVIYDSRVATAVTSILDPTMQFVSQEAKWQSFRNLGTVPGRGGSRPRDLCWHWPNGYRVWASQTAANPLCREVLGELNRQAATRPDCRKLNDLSPWTLREVEAVLFMEGY